MAKIKAEPAPCPALEIIRKKPLLEKAPNTEKKQNIKNPALMVFILPKLSAAAEAGNKREKENIKKYTDKSAISLGVRERSSEMAGKAIFIEDNTKGVKKAPMKQIARSILFSNKEIAFFSICYNILYVIERVKMTDENKALELLKTKIKNENLIKHCLASCAVMKALAKRLGGDEKQWGMAGLIHDIDVELTQGRIQDHTKEAEIILKENGFSQEIIEAVKMHNPAAWNFTSQNPFHIALRCGETVTGLIIASALVSPDKKLSSVKVSSVLKRMKDKRFAAGADRNVIAQAENLGLNMEEFISICLKAMQDIAGQLGL